MGEIDQDGYFVFSKKRGYRDAWLEWVLRAFSRLALKSRSYSYYSES